MNIKRKLTAAVLAIMLALSLSVVGFACALSSSTLADGTYRIDRIYVNGNRITETHALWAGLNTSYFVVNGSSLTINVEAVMTLSMTVQHRVRGGYLEQRHAMYTNNQWIRENGTAPSGFVSSRVENGEIVMRHGTASQLGIASGGRVYFFYNRNVTAPDDNNGNEDGDTSYLEQLLGRWYLHVQYTTPQFGYTRPGDALWMGEYFIEFNADRTFTELNFWHYPFEVSGAFTIDGLRITLATNSPTGGITFVPTRTIEFSQDTHGAPILTMRYTRVGVPTTLNYTNTFMRTRPASGSVF